MSSPALFRQYFTSSMASGLAKVVRIGAGIVVVGFINALAGKSEFGLFMIAYSLAFMIAISIETFFQNLILYHTGRADESGAQHHDIMRTSLYWGMAAASVAGILMALAAPWIEAGMGQTGLAPWIAAMAGFIPAHTALTLLTTCYRADHKVVTMALYLDVIPSLLLIASAGLITVLGLNVFLIGGAHIASFILAFVVLFLQNPIALPEKFLGLTRWDIGYGFKSMAVYVANQPGLGLDVLFVGQFCDASTTAEYALASRFAQILMLPKMAIAQLQVPRMGRFFKNGDKQGLKSEFEALQDIGLLATVFGCLGYVLLALPVIQFFGDYRGAYAILMILCAGSLIKAGFGASGGYLGMAGYAGWLFITSSGSVIVLVAALLTLIPLAQGMGAGYALAIHALVTMGAISLVIKKEDGMNLMRPATALYMAAVIGALALCGYQIISIMLTALCLISLSAAYLYFQRQTFSFFTRAAKENA